MRSLIKNRKSIYSKLSRRYSNLNKSKDDRSIIFTFCGQGSQYPGMGKDLFQNFKAVREVYERIEESIKFSLSNIMFNGTEYDLSLTENTQPALLAHSLGVISAINSILGCDILDNGKYIIGHSVGEISALTAASSFEIEDAAKLTRLRGHLMQSCAPSNTQTSVVALFPKSEFDDSFIDYVKDISNQTGEIVDIANINSPKQYVISGTEVGINNVINKGKEDEIIAKSIKLKVSAPFHSRFMLPVEEKIRETFKNIKLKEPKVEIISNLKAKPIYKTDDISESLIQSISRPVQFSNCIKYCLQLDSDINFVEIGPRKTLSSFISHHDPNAKTQFIGRYEDILDFIKTLENKR